jgi:hypothetical protein
MILEGASQVCILGFGFDETNINRLAPEKTLINKKVYATCHGMTTAEAKKASLGLKMPKYEIHHSGTDFPSRFMCVNCTTILRETSFLD